MIALISGCAMLALVVTFVLLTTDWIERDTIWLPRPLSDEELDRETEERLLSAT